ncbi:glutamate receptor ionotropic, kainate 1 [Anthonomus grandis grandis]|uniref:glutamate receptor ionotropic, kainate 1 n=1 Tax=Anthonomus grandis grandis TaxID=2921223 RepID=UPI002165C130|nr:glutamate receptor ionotropic, kainate 1 [Anthonomus grandis grandis]
MGLAELVLTGLAALCLNSTCVQDQPSFITKRYEKLKEELKNETLIVTTLKNGPLSGYKIVDGSPIGTGVAFDILHILQDEYGFKYELKIPSGDMFDSDSNGKGGVRNMLINQTVDVAVAFLPQQYDDLVSYSRSLDTAQWVVLMKRPKESASGSGLLAPFTGTVWTLIIISLLAVGPILWLVVLLRARMCKEDNDIVFSLPSCMWFVYGALLKQGSTLSPKTDSSRILFSTWWIFITILTAFYTANLTAFLTLSKFTLPIESPNDISSKRYKWLTNKGNGILEQLETSKKFSIGDGKSLFEEIGLPKVQVDAEEETILNKYISKQNYMYIREKTVLELIMYDDYKRKVNTNIEESERCTYVITTFPVCVFPRSFAFKPGFKYKEIFDQTIQHLSESGITEFKQREFLPDTTICPLNLGSKERKLRNSDLMMTYMIVGGGLIISTIIFAIELLIVYVKRDNCCQKQHGRSTQLFSKSYKVQYHGQPFVTPPPSYHTLFSKPPIAPGSECKKEVINGRQYWVINDKNGLTSLIPQRAPSALLFQYTQ